MRTEKYMIRHYKEKHPDQSYVYVTEGTNRWDWRTNVVSEHYYKMYKLAIKGKLPEFWRIWNKPKPSSPLKAG